MNQLERRYPMLSVGRGPWRVFPECPSGKHNSVRAARGMYGWPRCICPRGLDLLAEDQRRAREYKQEKLVNPAIPRGNRVKAIEKSIQKADYITNIDATITPPDLSGGACRWPSNRGVMDRSIRGNGRGGDHGKVAREAQAICAQCPLAVKQKCGEWALLAEKPAGAWGGVYGGMTPAQRRAMKAGITKVKTR